MTGLVQRLRRGAIVTAATAALALGAPTMAQAGFFIVLGPGFVAGGGVGLGGVGVGGAGVGVGGGGFAGGKGAGYAGSSKRTGQFQNVGTKQRAMRRP